MSNRTTLASISPRNFYRRWIAAHETRTRKSYHRAYVNLAAYLDVRDPPAAAAHLLGLDASGAVALVRGCRAAMPHKGKTASGSIHATAFRMFAAAARQAGLTTWDLAEVKPGTPKPVRTVRALAESDFTAMLTYAAAQRNPAKARRDEAILSLLHDVAARSHEVELLSMQDLELHGDEPRVWVHQKGQIDKAPVELPAPTVRRLRAWLEIRGVTEPGFVFGPVDRSWNGRYDKALSHAAVWNMVKAIGEAVGVDVAPHEIRHGAATEAARATGGDAFAVAAFTRHRNPAQAFRYVSRWRERGPEVAKIVAGK